MKRWRYRTVSDWNISFIKQYWRYFHSGEVSVNHQSWTAGIPLKRRTAGTLLPIIWYTWSCDFEKYLYLKYSWTQMCRWVDIFQSHIVPSWWCYKLLGRSVIWTTPKSCTYPTLVTTDPLEVSFKFINSNCFPFWKGCTICLAQLAFMILYLLHRDVTVWHRPDLLNTGNIWAWNYKIMLQISKFISPYIISKFISPYTIYLISYILLLKMI